MPCIWRGVAILSPPPCSDNKSNEHLNLLTVGRVTVSSEHFYESYISIWFYCLILVHCYRVWSRNLERWLSNWTFTYKTTHRYNSQLTWKTLHPHMILHVSGTDSVHIVHGGYPRNRWPHLHLSGFRLSW